MVAALKAQIMQLQNQLEERDSNKERTEAASEMKLRISRQDFKKKTPTGRN
jgi:hypothetical protein